MNKIPQTIYLQIGDECPDDIDFDKLTEVSWCGDKINENDIEYKLKSQHGKLFTELGELISEQQHTGDWQFNDNSDVRKFTEICNGIKKLNLIANTKKHDKFDEDRDDAIGLKMNGGII